MPTDASTPAAGNEPATITITITTGDITATLTVPHAENWVLDRNYPDPPEDVALECIQRALGAPYCTFGFQPVADKETGVFMNVINTNHNDKDQP